MTKIAKMKNNIFFLWFSSNSVNYLAWQIIPKYCLDYYHHYRTLFFIFFTFLTFQYSVQIRENTDQKKLSVFGHFHTVRVISNSIHRFRRNSWTKRYSKCYWLNFFINFFPSFEMYDLPIPLTECSRIVKVTSSGHFMQDRLFTVK